MFRCGLNRRALRVFNWQLEFGNPNLLYSFLFLLKVFY